MRKHDLPFDWFDLANYAGAENFNFSDWRTMLLHRRTWRETLDTTYPRGVPKQAKADFWAAYLSDVLPSKMHKNRGNRWLRGWDHEGVLTPPPCIVDITEECSKALDRVVRGLKYQKQFFDTRNLTVNMIAPDKVIKQAFADWLREQRKQPPARRRRKPSANFEVTGKHLRSWARYKVLAVLDLDFYTQVFGIERLTHARLADFLECNVAHDPKAWGKNARAKAAEATRRCVSGTNPSKN